MKLKIRTRIMLLYLLLSAVLLAVLLPVVYASVSVSLKRSMESELQIEASKLITSAEVEDGTLAISSVADVDIDRGVEIGIFCDGQMVYANTASTLAQAEWMLTASGDHSGSEIDRGGQSWMVVRQEFALENQTAIVVAACSMASVQDSMQDLLLLLLGLAPLFLGISAAGAVFLAHRALRPITDITKTALQIGAGDLTQRIPQLETRDEVGELTLAFNQMLDNVEASFQRERQFSSDASHELRTPVAVITACAEDALTENQTPRTTENLHSIQKESERMGRIISQLLTLTRGYEGRYRIEKDFFSMMEMVDSVMDELADEAQTAEIELCNHVPEDFLLVADQSLMTALFMNLIGNAIKYGCVGGHVWVSAKQENAMVEIRVQDDGVGIDEKDLPHVFERFYRADKARDRSGSGLGLAIVKWIVDIHDGRIWAENTMGQGSCFVVTMKVGKE
ncbi:MAG: HAMP domain-containing sensor histidine kinase [Pygmaiobacter sp.]|nr:HAMP domain-containing sensor histidine kinase [Pygmaiobacter sp.]